MGTHELTKLGDENGLGSRKVKGQGNPMILGVFCIKIGKLEGRKGFFPGKNCKLWFVRGTISFYNKKLQILPVGEGAMWNIQM